MAASLPGHPPAARMAVGGVAVHAGGSAVAAVVGAVGPAAQGEVQAGGAWCRAAAVRGIKLLSRGLR